MATRSAERTQFLSDVMIAFIEDFGTNDWRQIADWKYPDDPAGYHCTFVEVEDDDEPKHHVTIETVAIGINKLVKGEIGMNARMLESLKLGDKENDAGDIDAYLADMIVQAGVFGELRYG